MLYNLYFALYIFIYKMASKDLIKELDEDFKIISMFNEFKFPLKYLDVLDESDRKKAEYLVEKLFMRFHATLSKEKQELIENVRKLVGLDNDISCDKAREYDDKGEYDKAFAIYNLLAQNGNMRAQNNLGIYYKNGLGVEKNEKKAFEYYKKAADNGNSKAQYNVGICYEGSIGVEKNEKKAFEYYKISADNNDESAQYAFGLCYEEGIGVEKNVEKAFEYYKKAADNDHSSAQYAVGLCYEEGIGTRVDIDMALHYYRNAYKNGYENANLRIIDIMESNNLD